jgi:hypothetical protein
MKPQPPASPSAAGRGRVLRVKEGYNPNSSSLGSIVFSFPAALVAAPVLLAGTAAWIAARLSVPAPDGAKEEPAKETREGDVS